MLIRDRGMLLAWLATVVVLVLCLTPKLYVPRREVVPEGIPHLDKYVHFAMFAAFGYFWARALVPRRYALVIGGALLLATGTEVAQGHPAINRDPDIYDGVADMVGACAAVGLVAGLKLGRTADTNPRGVGGGS